MKFLDSTFILAFATCVLYFFGVAWVSGYLYHMGIDAATFSYSFQDFVYFGFKAVIGEFSTGAYFSIYLVAIYVAVVESNILEKIKNRITPNNTPPLKSTSKKALKVAIFLFSLWTLMLITPFFHNSIMQQGKDEAEAFINSINKKESSLIANVATIEENKMVRTTNLFRIQCSSSICAGIQKTTKNIYFFEPKNMMIIPVEKSLATHTPSSLLQPKIQIPNQS